MENADDAGITICGGRNLVLFILLLFLLLFLFLFFLMFFRRRAGLVIIREFPLLVLFLLLFFP